MKKDVQKQENRETRKEKTNLIIASGGLLVSLISIAFSIFTYKHSDDQFQIINQGYLEVKPTVSMIVSNPKLTGKIQPSDSSLYVGLSIGATLTNLGNIPIKYNVVKYSLNIQGMKLDNLLPKGRTIGILYPKQLLDFTLNPYLFMKDTSEIKYSKLRNEILYLTIYIEYNDLNISHKKIIDRDVDVYFTGNSIEIRIVRWGDSI